MTLKVGTSVKFTQSWLAGMTAIEAIRCAGRVGKITGYRQGTSDPIVVFPKHGRYKELKYFEVDVRNLEVVSDFYV